MLQGIQISFDSRTVRWSALPVGAGVFDLFSTLTVPVDAAEFRSSRRAMARAVGVDPDAFEQGWSRSWRERYDGTYPTIHACVRSVCTAIGARVDATAIGRAAQIRIESERRTLQPRVDAVDTLNRLRALGLQTALISNCSPEVPALWMTTPLVQVIDEPLFSSVEGLIKPDPAIYVRACERLGVDARECVYVGDGESQELTGAERVGMRAVLIKTPRDRARSHGSERDTWQGEAIEALSELPGLVTGAGSAASG